MAPFLLVPLTPAEQRALDALVPPSEQTGDLLLDLRAAFAETRRRRLANSENGGRVLAALYRELHEAKRRGEVEREGWEALAELLGEPTTTLRRWAADYREDQ